MGKFLFKKMNYFCSDLRVDQLWSVFGSQCHTHTGLNLRMQSCLSLAQQDLTLALLTLRKCVNALHGRTPFCVTVSVHSEIDHSSFLSFGEEVCVQKAENQAPHQA